MAAGHAELSADNSGFVQLVEFAADSLMPPEQQSFVASRRQRRWFTLMEQTSSRDNA
jgi:hypothetical protein